MNTDARAFYHYHCTVVTPAMVATIPGKGSEYICGFVDVNGQPFDGSKTYKLHVPAGLPTARFWSMCLYDSQTRSPMKNDQTYPEVASHRNKFKKNADGSIDLYVGPRAPKGYEENWLQSIPGKSWFVLFRNYGPGKAWLDQTYRIGEIELVE